MCDSKTCREEMGGEHRRSFLRKTGAAAFAAVLGGTLSARSAIAAGAETEVPKPQNTLSPDESIKRLIEGNARYVSGVMRRHDFAHEREALNGGQNPYAAILSCADSRVAPEYAFDSARGDLFVTRVAGNFVSTDMLGSLEYAVAVLNVPVIVVLGHDKCGAVDAAVRMETKGATFPGRIQALASAILPSVIKVRASAADLLDAAIAQNVLDSMDNLRARSDIVKSAEEAGRLKIAGGVYRLNSGKVEFLS
ncbi:carbonic anhydrase [Burkholderia sp. RF4-BP95]|uniref:carbonic anhydrase n=1 Tax=Burkholderia sp. RF4-BP95 TaxID=1637845 RepID=UPI00075E7495|nr:carbonic anhydrase [Burkholderia sp. RF4-BP95]KUY84082.1 carbonic anhydrase [Burkholderia sp. RF4-BP95]